MPLSKAGSMGLVVAGVLVADVLTDVARIAVCAAVPHPPGAIYCANPAGQVAGLLFKLSSWTQPPPAPEIPKRTGPPPVVPATVPQSQYETDHQGP